MKVLGKRWRRPLWGLLTVGLVAAIGYFIGDVEQLKQFLPPNAASADSEARERVAAVLGRMQSSGDVGVQPGDLRVTLRSPIAGTVVEINATSGELVDGRRQLFRIVDLDKLWIEANVSEYDLARVQQAPGASYRLAAYPGRIVPILDGGGRLIDIGA